MNLPEGTLARIVENALVFNQYLFRRHVLVECERVTSGACSFTGFVVSHAGLLSHILIAIRRLSGIRTCCDDSTSHPRGDHG